MLISSSKVGETSLHGSENGLLVILVSVVSLFLLSTLMIRIGSLYLIVRKYPVMKGNGFRLIETDLSEAPFSFLHFLFWKRNIDFNTEEGQLILKHELTHIRQRHTYDMLFSQILVCIFWMNPFYWIIRKELTLIHEFIADDKSVGQGNGVMFAKMLLLANYEGQFMDPTHSFFHSPIKRRLFMITKNGDSKYNYLSRIFILPVITIIFFVLSFNITRAQSEPSNTDSGKIIKVNDEQKSKKFDQYHPEGRTPTSEEVKILIESILNDPPVNRIYFIDGKRVSSSKVKKLKYSMITDTRMLPPEESLERFGVTGEKGTISFLLKK
jgi:hypothetical protein